MSVENLKDGFRASGIDFDQFVEVNNRMAESTNVLNCRGADISFLSLDETGADPIPGAVIFDAVNYTQLENFRDGTAKLPFFRSKVSFQEVGETILNELQDSSRLAIMVNNTIYYVSSLAMATFCMQASLGGDMMINNHGLIRNMMLADSIITKNTPISLIYREEKNEYGVLVKKVFAVLGKTYKLIPQNVVQRIKKAVEANGDMGKTTPGYWEIDHDFTSINISFPEFAEELTKEFGCRLKVTPGVQISTSDTGASSIIVRGTYQTEKSYVITDEVAKKHTAGLDLNMFLEDVKRSIFENFRTLPQLLATMVGEPVYGGTDPEMRTQEMKDIFEYVLEKIGKIAGADFPKKQRKQILECMVEEIDPSICYTLYDVAMTFMDLPERVVGLNRESMLVLRRACANAPKIVSEYKEITPVYLTA